MAKWASLFRFEALAVPRSEVELAFAAHQRHLAYNYFTKLLLEHRSEQVEDAIMFADAKCRIKEDNFLEYLVLEMNLGVPFRKGAKIRRVLKKVEPLDSKLDDLMQLTDLLTGCANNWLGQHVGGRKQQVRHEAEALGLIHHENVWIWEPKKKRRETYELNPPQRRAFRSHGKCSFSHFGPNVNPSPRFIRASSSPRPTANVPDRPMSVWSGKARKVCGTASIGNGNRGPTPSPGAPRAVAQRSTVTRATTQYCQVVREDYLVSL